MRVPAVWLRLRRGLRRLFTICDLLHGQETWFLFLACTAMEAADLLVLVVAEFVMVLEMYTRICSQHPRCGSFLQGMRGCWVSGLASSLKADSTSHFEASHPLAKGCGS